MQVSVGTLLLPVQVPMKPKLVLATAYVAVHAFVPVAALVDWVADDWVEVGPVEVGEVVVGAVVVAAALDGAVVVGAALDGFAVPVLLPSAVTVVTW